MLRNSHPTRVLKYPCRRTLPARSGLFSEAPRSLRFQCSQHKHSHGWALAARAPKIAGAPSGSHDLWIPSRGTKVAIRQKSGEILLAAKSTPFCSGTFQRGLWATGWADAVCEQLKSCVCVSAMFARGLRGASARGLRRPDRSCVSP
jgi:hypothetical protein|mmetsp:Transcript_88503/g.129428  ORF Transcript_88503/g.129428 Transcript_88503/m.129428 type:complete len:147 (-) Transcript_88503:14-454(-)